MRKRDVLLYDIGPSRIRFVTHYHITRADVDQTLVLLREVVMAG